MEKNNVWHRNMIDYDFVIKGFVSLKMKMIEHLCKKILLHVSNHTNVFVRWTKKKILALLQGITWYCSLKFYNYFTQRKTKTCKFAALNSYFRRFLYCVFETKVSNSISTKPSFAAILLRAIFLNVTTC